MTPHPYLRAPCRLRSCSLQPQPVGVCLTSTMWYIYIIHVFPPCLAWKGPTSPDLCLGLVQDLALIDDTCTSIYRNGKLSVWHCRYYNALQGAKRSGEFYKVHKVRQGFRRFADACGHILLLCSSPRPRRDGTQILSQGIPNATCV